MEGEELPESNPQVCSYCLNPPSPELKTCSACKAAWYCSIECQRNHWKVHKAPCKVAAKAIRDAAGLCTRCEQALTSNSGQCLVPHPKSMREFAGSTYSNGESKESWHCGACSKTFTILTNAAGISEHIEGPKYCLWYAYHRGYSYKRFKGDKKQMDRYHRHCRGDSKESE